MSKTKWITLLSTAVLVMAGGSRALADDVVSDGTTIPDTSQVMPSLEPTTPTEPDTPVNPSTAQPTSPEEPAQPLDPAQPSTGDEVTPTDPSQPSEQPTPSEPETKPEVNDKDTTPAVETPKEEVKTPTEAPKLPQEGELSKTTGQVVSVVTPEAPIETSTGVSIVSTQEGQLVLSDGSKVAPETVGAKTNDDKTITVTKADGTKATLPHTGEAQTLGLSLLGLAMAGLGFAFWKKKKTN